MVIDSYRHRNDPVLVQDTPAESDVEPVDYLAEDE